jgi:regulator of replication initiation timing
MLDSNGKTVGFDLYCEVQPNVWVHANDVPANVLAEERRRGQLQHGIFYGGKLIDKLNIHNIHDKLLAAKLGLELKVAEYKGGTTAFKAQVGNPLEELAKQIQGLMQKIQELRTLESEARKAEVEALVSRVKKLKRTAEQAEAEEGKEEKKIKPEDVEPHPLDYLVDLTRVYRGKTLSTQALEQLCRAQRITEFIDENNDLLANPKKLAALRRMLLQ